jgi:hypothetical protein
MGPVELVCCLVSSNLPSFLVLDLHRASSVEGGGVGSLHCLRYYWSKVSFRHRSCRYFLCQHLICKDATF